MATNGLEDSYRPMPVSRTSASLSNPYIAFVVVMLFLTHVLGYVDRMAMAVLLPAIKRDLSFTDAELGLLTGIAFTFSYALLGVPVARIADRGNRRNVIGVAIIIWSAATAASGAVHNFIQMFLARVGVGAGEAGCIPPAHSMISDLTEGKWRVRALSFYTTGMPIGALVGLAIGGWLSDLVGWRGTFLIFGAIGLVLAALLALTVREPARRAMPRADAPASRIGPDLRQLLKQRSYLFLLGGLAFAGFAITGLVQWLPSYFARTYDMPIRQIGLYFGIAYGLGSMSGILIGGFVAAPFIARDERFSLWMATGAYVIAFPILLTALLTKDFRLAMGCSFVGFVLLTAPFGPVYALVQDVVASRLRALAVSFTLLASNLIGAGLGPLIIGAVSDIAAAHGAANPLQVGMLSGMAMFPFPALLYLIGARFVPDDLARTRAAETMPLS